MTVTCVPVCVSTLCAGGLVAPTACRACVNVRLHVCVAAGLLGTVTGGEERPWRSGCSWPRPSATHTPHLDASFVYNGAQRWGENGLDT